MNPAARMAASGSRVVLLKHWRLLSPPLFILGPPRSFTSLVCAMLGQHPQMYGLPETHLFAFDTLSARAQYAAGASYPMAHGLLRAVAQLYFGAQTKDTIQRAQQWLDARPGWTPDLIFKVLGDRVFPRVLVDKSPSNIGREVLERMRAAFPGARFIHLLRHPRAYAKSVLKFIQERTRHGPIPPSHWLMRISSFPPPDADPETYAENGILNPQNGWYALHKLILGFLDSIPAAQRLRVRGEDLVQSPDKALPEIAAWMNLRTDPEAIEQMKHPEHSPYASLGPPGARYGNDVFFLQDPVLRPARAAEPLSLDGPLEWRNDGAGFCAEVKSLANEFGYN